MKVLGVDPGTAATGYGVVVREDGGAVSLVECGVIRTDRRLPLPQRLRDIFEGLEQIIDRHRPAAIAVEGVFYARNARSSLTLGQARGVVLLAGARRELAVHEYSPAEVKNAIVGTGRASKEQVQFMVQKLLRLRAAPRPEDAADGVAVALAHCFALVPS